jgi:D-alanyl-D-alanine carboxypeptidase
VAVIVTIVMLAAACSGSRRSSPDDAAASADRATGDPTRRVPLPVARLQGIADSLPASLGVPGVVVGVSKDGETWIGAAGVDDTSTATPMDAGRQFRIASITKLFTVTVIMGMVEHGDLSLDDRLSRWYPSFPNAADITVRMLLTHTAGVNTDWWEQPDIVQAAADNLSREWTPDEVIDLIAARPPAGPPGGVSLYSNTGFILLGQIAAKVGGAPIGALIESRVIKPLGLVHTTFQFDNPPNLAHAYYDYAGQTLDVGRMDMRAFTSMAGAAGAVHSDAADLLAFLDALFASDRLLEPSTVRSLQSTELTGIRWGVGPMGFCPCEGTGAATTYTGWGHVGDFPGFFSVGVHYVKAGVSIVVFLNRDVVGGQPFDHGFLDPVVERLLEAAK